MVYIVKIPLFYRTTAYPSSTNHPTTTARYVVLPTNSDSKAKTQNSAIFQDALGWGWRVYDVDRTDSKMKTWFEKYDTAARTSTWDDDIWRIWQREHGVRILEKDMALKGDSERNLSAMQLALRNMGSWVQRHTSCRDGLEWDLRQLEDRKRTQRLEKKARKNTVMSNNQSQTSTLSLPGSFTERLEGFQASRSESDAVQTVGEDALMLTRHAWMSRGA
jgi:hypothetical protein